MRLAFAVALICAAPACKKQDDAAKTDQAAPTPPSAPASTAEPVDTCALMPKDQIEAKLGTPDGEPKRLPARNALLGHCSWMFPDYSNAAVSARPVGELAETTGKQVPGIGEQAMFSDGALVVKLAGKPYYLQVMVMTPKGLDEARTLELAKIAVANVK